MKILKAAAAGTLESSDVQIQIFPNPDGGIELEIKSVVQTMFGEAIRETVLKVLEEFGVEDALVQVNDKGALDHVIRARMQAVICRAAEYRYDWTKEN